MAWFRLPYSVTRDFSKRRSFLGFFLIFSGVGAAIAFTLYTKGRVYSSDIYFRGKTDDSDEYRCNGTAIYPGQTFGGHTVNASFVYSSEGSFVYTGKPLSNCALDPYFTLDVIGPPLAWPHFAWNHSVQCIVDGSTIASFKVQELDHYGGLNSMGTGIWNTTVQTLGRLTSGLVCGTSPIFGFRIEGDRLLFPSEDTISICISPLSEESDIVSRIRGIIAQIKEATLRDFAGGDISPMSPLPGVLFPCTPTARVWAQPLSILWDCATAAFAVISPVIFIVSWLLQKGIKTTEEKV